MMLVAKSAVLLTMRLEAAQVESAAVKGKDSTINNTSTENLEKFVMETN